MLFDEPTSALDPTMVGEVLATLRLLAKQGMTTMVIVTHEMEFAKEIASRILYMDEQGIYEEGTPQEIFEAPQKKKTRDFIHKMKYLSWRIETRAFDLMQLQGNICSFASRYGLDAKKTNRLQLCTEELIYEMLDYGQADGTRIYRYRFPLMNGTNARSSNCAAKGRDTIPLKRSLMTKLTWALRF